MRISEAGNWNKGFTLIELVMVLFIVGLSLGMLLPGMDRLFAGDALKTTVNRVLSGARQVRSQAMLDAQPWVLIIDTMSDGTTDISAKLAVLDREARTLLLRPDTGTRFRDVALVRTGEVVKDGLVSLTFLPNGLAEPALIHCLARDGRVQTISLKSFNPRPVVVAGDKHLAEKPLDKG